MTTFPVIGGEIALQIYRSGSAEHPTFRLSLSVTPSIPPITPIQLPNPPTASTAQSGTGAQLVGVLRNQPVGPLVGANAATHTCSECGKRWSRKSGLQMHQSINHPQLFPHLVQRTSNFEANQHL